MTLHSLTNQDIFDSRYEETVYSGEKVADLDAKVNYDDYKRRSQEFNKGERLKTASHDPDSAFKSASNSNCKTETINELVAPMQLRAVQKISSRSGVRSLTPLMEWEGSVEAIESDEFVARLLNVTTGELLPTEEASFPLSELNDIQRDNLEVGAIFRWVIGLQRLPNGNKQRVSELFFRRLPAHSEREINAAVVSKGMQLDALDWDDAPSR